MGNIRTPILTKDKIQKDPPRCSLGRKLIDNLRKWIIWHCGKLYIDKMRKKDLSE